VCSVAGLTPVLIAESVRSLLDRPGAGAIASGFALSALGGVAYVARVSPAPWLTYIDVAHLLTVASLALIYRGVMERAGPELAVAAGRAVQEPANTDPRGWPSLGT